MAAIDLQGVTRRFPDGTVAVNEVDLHIDDGEFVILVGPSGCGKSTLLRMIVGLEEVTAGHVTIGDRDVTGAAPRDRNLAMVFQNYALYPHLDVRENMAFPLKLAKVGKREIAERVDRAAKLLELEELLDRKPANLSGGQRQRVAMGRALVREPDAYLLDEPLSNLDAKLRVQMRFELARLHQRLGTTTVYVTHDQTEAMTLGDRVAVMRKGVLQQVATPKELYLSPANLFVAGFIGSPSMNFFPAEIDGDRVRLPMCEYKVDGAIAERLAGNPGAIVAGIRPEHFDDVTLVGRSERREGARFNARVEMLEWLGSELFAHFDVELSGPRGGSGVEEVADELEEAGVRGVGEGLTVARIDPASDLTPGCDAEFWLATDRIHYFDGESGENLLRAHGPGEERLESTGEVDLVTEEAREGRTARSPAAGAAGVTR